MLRFQSDCGMREKIGKATAENRQKMQMEKIFINMEHLSDAFAS